MVFRLLHLLPPPPPPQDGRTQVQTSQRGNIVREAEFRFCLLSSWSLYDAMYYSNYVSSRMSCFKGRGEGERGWEWTGGGEKRGE